MAGMLLFQIGIPRLQGSASKADSYAGPFRDLEIAFQRALNSGAGSFASGEIFLPGWPVDIFGGHAGQYLIEVFPQNGNYFNLPSKVVSVGTHQLSLHG